MKGLTKTTWKRNLLKIRKRLEGELIKLQRITRRPGYQ